MSVHIRKLAFWSHPTAPALSTGSVVIITGAASGIGLQRVRCAFSLDKSNRSGTSAVPPMAISWLLKILAIDAAVAVLGCLE